MCICELVQSIKISAGKFLCGSKSHIQEIPETHKMFAYTGIVVPLYPEQDLGFPHLHSPNPMYAQKMFSHLHSTLSGNKDWPELAMKACLLLVFWSQFIMQ